MKFFIIILIIFVFSCEKPPPSQIDRNCNCGIIIETTTGDGDLTHIQQLVAQLEQAGQIMEEL